MKHLIFIPLSLFAITLFSCKKDGSNPSNSTKETASLVEDKVTNEHLFKYKRYEENYLKNIQSGNLDLTKVYSDSANYYDSLINVNTKKLPPADLIKFNDVVNELKTKRMEALSRTRPQ